MITPFNETQQAVLNKFITNSAIQAIRNLAATNVLPSESAGPPGPPSQFGQFEQPGVSEKFHQTKKTFDQNGNRWNSGFVKILDFMYDDKSAIIGRTVQHAKKIYFRDVHVFINKIKNFAEILLVDNIKQNFWICFKNTILLWYTFELTKNEKKLGKYGNNVDE